MDKQKAQQVLKEAAKTIGIILAFWTPLIAVLVFNMVCNVRGFNYNGSLFAIALVIGILVAIYGPPWYLIHRFAKGKVKVALYALLVLSPVVYSFFDREPDEIISSVTATMSVIAEILIALAVLALIYLIAKDEKVKAVIKNKMYLGCILLVAGIVGIIVAPRTEITIVSGCLVLIGLKLLRRWKWEKDGLLAKLKGYHVYGLSMATGTRVRVRLYLDKIAFMGNGSTQEISFQDITNISSYASQEYLGQTTTTRRNTSWGSISAATSGNMAMAWLLSPTTTSTTKDIYKTYWYLDVETKIGSIQLHVKSEHSLSSFVEKCNKYIVQAENNSVYDGESKAEDIDIEQFDERERIDIDKVSGTDFEHLCAELLRINGWTDVQVTPGSGDHGIDITAEKDGAKWGFQCKRWKDTKVDSATVRQTFAGKALYECDMAVIITTSTLTAQAQEEAKRLGVKVWEWDKINQLKEKLNNADN